MGAPFVEIKSFAAYVGGSPTNIAVGARRLGCVSAVLTPSARIRWGLHPEFSQERTVEARFILRKPRPRTSASFGHRAADKFPLVYYRDNCADNQLSIDDVLKTPIQDCRVFEFSGTGLSKEPSAAPRFCRRAARAAGATVVLDLTSARTSGTTRERSASPCGPLPAVDIVLGTEDECKAVTLTDPAQVNVTHSQISGAQVAGDLDAAVQAMQRRGPQVVVVKRGEKGATVFEAGKAPADVPGFPVEIYNVLGAGDAFAAGFIYGLVKNWDYFKAARMGNAGGAIVVTRHGCANFMAYEDEALKFIAEQGGF